MGVLNYGAVTSAMKRKQDFIGYSVMEISHIELLRMWYRQGGSVKVTFLNF